MYMYLWVTYLSAWHWLADARSYHFSILEQYTNS